MAACWVVEAFNVFDYVQNSGLSVSRMPTSTGRNRPGATGDDRPLCELVPKAKAHPLVVHVTSTPKCGDWNPKASKMPSTARTDNIDH